MGNRSWLAHLRRLAAIAGLVGAVAIPLLRATPVAYAQPQATALVGVVQTDSGLSQLMAPQPGVPFSTTAPSGVPVIDVDDGTRYQRFTGVGGTMTDSAAWLIYDELASPERLALMQALFGSPGLQGQNGVPALHLNFLRIAMGASGAMTVGAPYSYDDMPSGQSDPDLSQFSIAHDLPYIVPTLQQARQINPGLEILANPWSPPAWMKTNNSLDNEGGDGALLSADYGALAQYFVDFLRAYAAQGIKVDAVTPQNEPGSGGVGTAYPGLTLPEGAEQQFVAQDLAPALNAAGLDTKIYGNDLSWDSLSYADALASGSAADDLAGIAWHCYFGSPTVMSRWQQQAPGLDELVDECSPEIRGFGTPEFLISSLRNWASVVSVWGLALDPQGGPIQPGNDCPGCTGVVMIDEQTHTVSFRLKYYQLGQVSAFVQPGAYRIYSPNFVAYGLNSSNIETVSPGLDDVAFLNPNGSKVLIADNTSTAPMAFAVESDGRYFSYTIPAQAMTTFTWDGSAPQTVSAPTTAGVTRQGQTLTAGHGTWSNDPVVSGDQWLRCDAAGARCAPIAGATGQAYTLAPDDVGSRLRVQEVAVNSGGAGSALSAASAVVLPLAPSSITAPTITGVAQQGHTLSEEHGSWSNSPTAYSYRWLRCMPSGAACTPIRGATAPTYKLTAGDVGRTVEVQESAINAGGTGGPIVSAPTALVMPGTASLQAVLMNLSAPLASAENVRSLLKHDGYARTFTAQVAGSVVVKWVYEPPRKGRARPVLVASAAATFANPGPVSVRVRLTRAGRRLLRAAGELKVTAEATYVSDGLTMSAKRRLILVTPQG